MDKTPLQERIEFSVSGGIGYDSQTDFSNTTSIYSSGLEADVVKNTYEGLMAHLRELDCPEIKKYGEYVGFLFSSSGCKMNVCRISDFGIIRNYFNNLKMVNKAYNTEAKKNGRIWTLINGFLKETTGNNIISLIESINIIKFSPKESPRP